MSERLSHDPWWRDSVVYQVYPRSFADSDGDGVGDLRGIVGQVDYLSDLGVDVVWLSPVYASPHDDNGYDISDYYSVDPAFGTLDDLDDLVSALHERGIRIVMDLVVNHTSDEHPWFVESAAGPDSPKRDWYWWRPARAGAVGGQPGAEPTNWGSFFSGSAWQWHEPTGEYYLHLFSRKQPDLNWENPEVREAIYAMMRWWLDRGIDGFRMDVINFISKDPALPDGVVAPGQRWGDGSPHYMSGPRIHEFLQEMRREVFAGRDSTYLTIGEMPGVTIEQARLFTDPARGELDMVFQFEHVALDHGAEGKWSPRELDVVELKTSLARWQEGLADTGWNSLYWSNHDQPRVLSRFGDPDHWYASATALATVLHLQRGTPFIYQGEELGMTNVPFDSIEQFRDIETLNYFHEAVEEHGLAAASVLDALRRASRDNARTPVHWTSDAHAGFTTGEPWIAVHPNHDRINASAQRGRSGSVYEYYRALIALRHTNAVVVDGTFRMLAPEHPAVFAFTRTGDAERLVIAANLSAQSVELPADVDLRGTVLLTNYADPARARLRPWEARVVSQPT